MAAFTITGMDLSGCMLKDAAVCCMAMINDTEGNMVTLHKRKA